MNAKFRRKILKVSKEINLLTNELNCLYAEPKYVSTQLEKLRKNSNISKETYIVIKADYKFELYKNKEKIKKYESYLRTKKNKLKEYHKRIS